MRSGFILGLGPWADTGCSGKNGCVDEFVEGKSVNVTGFTSNLGSIYNLTIDHVLYEFDKQDETVVLLEHNNNIFMGYNMIDSLGNPVQCEDNDVIFNLITKAYYPNNNNSQSITFPGGTSIPDE